MSQTLQPIEAAGKHRRFNSSVADGVLPSIDMPSVGMNGIGASGPPQLASPAVMARGPGLGKEVPGAQTARTISTLNTAQKQLVNFSVRAQNFILKKELQSQTTGADDPVAGGIGRNAASKLGSVLDESLAGIEASPLVNKSQNFATIQHSPRHSGSAFQLPQINSNAKAGPFKGFLDISIVTQKLRKNLASEGRRNNNTAVRGGSQPPDSGRGEGAKEGKVAVKGKLRSGSKPAGGGLNMSPKVLETWINETLQDAEHLDIPGVILKPEQKLPIQRYQIDRQELQKQGIPADEVNRVYRGLFVYSVGFYELLNKCLEHTNKKYTVITALWKVFSILLEYCCRTDYRMLIQEISLEHQKEMERLEAKYQAKFAQQANNEKIIKQNMEILQKYSETLEKERMNERQMRLKLEEEYAQNTRNHEEEVQLRLKFEKKLNEMHGEHRDLNTKYVRACKDLADFQEGNKRLQEELDLRVAENTRLSQDLVENKSRMTNNVEKLRTLERDKERQAQQITEYDNRISKIQDELDLAQYKMQEQQKEISEMKLTTDVLTSDNDGLRGEKAHLTTDLKETRSLLRTYEDKTKDLMKELADETAEHQELKRNMIGHNETKRNLETLIDKLKTEVAELQNSYDQLQIAHGSLEIEQQKVNEQLEQHKKDLAETAERQHRTNKARHEFEIKAGEAEEKVKAQEAVLEEKERLLERKQQELEELEKKCHQAQQSAEAMDTKKQAIERQFELTKKQLQEKIGNLNEIMQGEKETREMWIDRYEKEQKEHQVTSAKLMEKQGEYRDQMLATKNADIKAQTLTRQVDILTQQNNKFQNQINEVMAKNELLDREVNTQKEIMRQFEQTKKEYVDKLKHELDTVEARFHKIINENNMVGEDYRSQAYINFHKYVAVKVQFTENLKKLTKAHTSIGYYKTHHESLQQQLAQDAMMLEDLNCQVFYKEEAIEKLKADMNAGKDDGQKEELDELREKLRKASDQIEQLTDQLASQRDDAEEEEAKELQLNIPNNLEKPEMVDEVTSPIKFTEQSSKILRPALMEAAVQTEDVVFADQLEPGSGHSHMSGSQLARSRSGQVPVAQSKSRSRLSRDSSKQEHLLHDSSTAVGTLQHGASKQMDSLDAGLAHNQSLEEHGASPGLRGAITKEVIEEGEEEDQEEPDSIKVKTGTLPPEGKGFPSVLSGAGMRSGRTLNHEMSGSEMGTSSVQSPSYKSLMRSKNNQQQDAFQEQLKKSKQQNSRQPAAPSGLKKALRRAIVNQ